MWEGDQTFYQWLDSKPAFAHRLSLEKRRVILESLDKIRNPTEDKEARWNGWFLERVYKDHFSPPQPGIGLNLQQNTFTISFEAAKQIEATREKLLPEVNSLLGLTNGNGEANGET